MNLKYLRGLVSGLRYFLLISVFLPYPASAQSSAPPARLSSLGGVIVVYGISSLIGFVSLASLGMLIIGGYKYMSAGSDKTGTQAAQQTILYAISGLIITLSAWVILNIMGLFVGVNLNSWDICIDPTGC